MLGLPKVITPFAAGFTGITAIVISELTAPSPFTHFQKISYPAKVPGVIASSPKVCVPLVTGNAPVVPLFAIPEALATPSRYRSKEAGLSFAGVNTFFTSKVRRVFVISQAICAFVLIFVAGIVTVAVVALADGLKVAKLVLAGLPDTAALVSIQVAPVITQVPFAGRVSVITVATFTAVKGVLVAAATGVFWAVVVTDVNVPPLLVANVNAPPTPAIPAPLVLFLTVNVGAGVTVTHAPPVAAAVPLVALAVTMALILVTDVKLALVLILFAELGQAPAVGEVLVVTGTVIVHVVGAVLPPAAIWKLAKLIVLVAGVSVGVPAVQLAPVTTAPPVGAKPAGNTSVKLKACAGLNAGFEMVKTKLVVPPVTRLPLKALLTDGSSFTQLAPSEVLAPAGFESETGGVCTTVVPLKDDPSPNVILCRFELTLSNTDSAPVESRNALPMPPTLVVKVFNVAVEVPGLADRIIWKSDVPVAP
jgi:hypothetical protein